MRSARATSSSPSGSLPNTQPVRISSRPPYTIQLASRASRLLPEDALGLALRDHPLDDREALTDHVDLTREVRAATDLAHHHRDEVRVVAPRAQEDLHDPPELLVRRLTRRLDLLEAGEELAPVLAEDRLQDLVLRREVVVEQPVRHARLLRDVPHPRGVEAAAGEDANGGVEDLPPLLLGSRLPLRD